MGKSLVIAIIFLATLGLFVGNKATRTCHVAVIIVTLMGFIGLWARVVPW